VALRGQILVIRGRPAVAEDVRSCGCNCSCWVT